MKEKYKNLPLRSGVGIVVLNKENKVFVAKRIDNKKNFWQMPQGGVDKGEDCYEAAKRELEEETSIKSVSLIKKIDGLLTYYLPNELLHWPFTQGCSYAASKTLRKDKLIPRS